MSGSMVRKSMEAFAAVVAISSVLTICSAIDTITATQEIKDGDILVSSGGCFELGFFSPGNSKYRYVGIWYKSSVTTVVWVANRKKPLNDKSGILKVNNSGFLNVVTSTNDIIWASSNTSTPVQNPVAQILESGNLVIREINDENPENFLWQSFDYPTDTQLPGMKLGINFVTGLQRYLSSWKSSDDPAPGEFTYHLDPTGYPQIILKKGLVEKYQTGPWNGLGFSGRPKFRNNKIYTHKLVSNKEEVYYMFELISTSALTRFVLNPNGTAERLIWVEGRPNWKIYLSTVPTDYCDTYKLCGAYGSCNINNGPVCSCLDRFEPKYDDNLAKTDWSDGCVRRKPLDCHKGDGFRKYSHVKLPDTRSSRFNESMTLEECESKCLKSCSCMAYASLNINGSESGCLQWIGDLIDIRELPEGGQDFYVRVAFSESDKKLMVPKSGSNGIKGKTIVMSLSLLVGTVLLGLSLAVYIWKKKKNRLLKRKGIHGRNLGQDNGIESQDQKEDLELPLFSLSTIAHATNYFSINNKLGQGGFGPVFKGVLEDGQEIAVKQLSKTSEQGPDEFMNELRCIAKLQHRNLVRLLGYCVQGDEKMLIYEYMPNKSLDLYIFDETRSTLLDWPLRFHIIDGIARGLLYLHQDSRLRIIHRDLKAGNILLDSDMNPKISDFGMARSFMKNETGANTNRVVGTYGYMSPEYAVDGLFSVKSDVFSFGVLILEIVSGDRNRGFIHRDHRHNLLGHAWRLHQEGRSLELVHAHISDSPYMSEVVRSIHIGLLCVQQSPEDRPNMSTVVMMLGSEGALPQPTHPGFFTERNIVEREYFSSARPTCSTDDSNSILLQGR